MRLINKAKRPEVNIKLIAVWVIIPFLFFQGNVHAQNPDTRKGYDLRGHGFDSAMTFITKYSPQLPITIGISTTDSQFIELLKKTFRKMDELGYENIAIIIHDVNPKSYAQQYSLTFYKNGDPIAHIEKIDSEWVLVSIKNFKATKRDVLTLPKKEEKYPVALIKTQVKMLYKK